MKKYFMPKIELIKLKKEDVLTASGGSDFIPGENELPIQGIGTN